MPDTLLATLDILGPAFIAGLLVLFSHVPLGRQVLARGIIFIDLAVAQAAATGALLATHLPVGDNDWTQQLVAAAAALLMVTLLHELEKRLPDIQEALIGASFVLLASTAILVTASDPHGGEHIHDLLAGQILWSDLTQLGWLAAATLASLTAMRFFVSPLLRFYIPFAIAITAAVQVVGVYLVFASLIFPALALRGVAPARATPAAIALGAAGYSSGLLISLGCDWPSGPTIVVALAICAGLTGMARYFAVRAGFLYNRQQP